MILSCVELLRLRDTILISYVKLSRDLITNGYITIFLCAVIGNYRDYRDLIYVDIRRIFFNHGGDRGYFTFPAAALIMKSTIIETKFFYAGNRGDFTLPAANLITSGGSGKYEIYRHRNQLFIPL